MEKTATKKKLNIVDILIIVVLLLAIVGIGLRFLLIKNTPDPLTLPDIEEKEYLVSYIVRDFRGSVVNYLEDGTELRFAATNNPFGTTYGTPITDDAERRYYTAEGEYVVVKNLAEVSEDGKDISHMKRFDIEGKIKVKGKLTNENDGILVINGSETVNVALNKPVSLRSDDLVITVTVTEVAPIE